MSTDYAQWEICVERSGEGGEQERERERERDRGQINRKIRCLQTVCIC